MVDALKPFFRGRTVGEMKRLERVQVHDVGMLVRMLPEIGAACIVVDEPVLPLWVSHYAAGGGMVRRKGIEASLKYWRDQPSLTLRAAGREPPAALLRDAVRNLERAADDPALLKAGAYGFEGTFPEDRRERRYHFATVLDGQRLFAYADGLACSDAAAEEQGLRVEAFPLVRDAHERGASFRVLVPDHRVGAGRRSVTLEHVPIDENRYAAEVARNRSWTVSPQRTDTEYQSIGRSLLLATPEVVAAELAAAQCMYTHQSVPVPLAYLPFPIVSPFAAMVDNALQGNVLVHDPTLRGQQLRPLHRAERSRLLGVAYGVFGYDRMTRRPGDPKLQDYAWRR